MRLRPENLSPTEQLQEFDQWMTARLERIKDTEKFNLELDSLTNCIENLSSHLDNFNNYKNCKINVLEIISKASYLASRISNKCGNWTNR